MKEIRRSLQSSHRSIGKIISQVLTETDMKQDIDTVIKKIDKTDEFIRYQQEEATFHPLIGSKKGNLEIAKEQIKLLRFIRYHVQNIDTVDLQKSIFNEKDKALIMDAKNDLARYFQTSKRVDVETYKQQLRALMKLFWTTNETVSGDNTQLPPGLIILYELISIAHLVQQLMELEAKLVHSKSTRTFCRKGQDKSS